MMWLTTLLASAEPALGCVGLALVKAAHSLWMVEVSPAAEGLQKS